MTTAAQTAETLMQSVQKIRSAVRGGLSIVAASEQLSDLRVQAESLPRRHGTADYGHQFDEIAADVEKWLAKRA